MVKELKVNSALALICNEKGHNFVWDERDISDPKRFYVKGNPIDNVKKVEYVKYCERCGLVVARTCSSNTPSEVIKYKQKSLKKY